MTTPTQQDWRIECGKKSTRSCGRVRANRWIERSALENESGSKGASSKHRATERTIHLPVLQHRHSVFAIEFGDEAGADRGGTNGFALVGVRAISEAFRVHYAYHFQDTARAFRVPRGRDGRGENFPARKNMADAVGHPAPQTPPPVQAAASLARAAARFAT